MLPPPPPPVPQAAEASWREWRTPEAEAEGGSSSSLGRWRPGINGGRQRYGDSGGVNKDYWREFYKAKQFGKEGVGQHFEPELILQVPEPKNSSTLRKNENRL